MTKRQPILTLKQQLNIDVEKINENIEIYRELIPKCVPLINKYEEFFDHATVYETSIDLTPKDSSKLPAKLFCEALEIGIIAKVFSNSGMSYHSTQVVLSLNKC